MKKFMDRVHICFTISCAVVLIMTATLIPVVSNRIQEEQNNEIIEQSEEYIISEEERTVEIDGHTITIPANHKFVQWATEGKSFIVEDQLGIQGIIILEFD